MHVTTHAMVILAKSYNHTLNFTTLYSGDSNNITALQLAHLKSLVDEEWIALFPDGACTIIACVTGHNLLSCLQHKLFEC